MAEKVSRLEIGPEATGSPMAFREKNAAYEAQRGVVCRARQFVESVTGG